MGGSNYRSAYYIVAVDTTNNRYYYRSLNDGDLSTSLTIGNTYTKNGNNYILSGDVTNISYIDWYNSSDLTLYKGKYVCLGNNTSCTDLKHINPESSPSSYFFYYGSLEDNHYYAENVSYNGTTYTLTGDIVSIWDLFDSNNFANLSTHHYTCFDNGTSCTTLGYISKQSGYLTYYTLLTGVTNINAAIDDMLYANNVNTKDSTIKKAIEAWYARYLSDYDYYIEDTLFCNNRTITSNARTQIHARDRVDKINSQKKIIGNN